jgi:hypothetical protein
MWKLTEAIRLAWQWWVEYIEEFKLASKEQNIINEHDKSKSEI